MFLEKATVCSVPLFCCLHHPHTGDCYAGTLPQIRWQRVEDESVNIYWIFCEWKLFKCVQEIRHANPTFQMFKMELAKWNVGVLKQLEKIFVKWRRKHPSKAGLTASYWYCLPHIFQILLLLSTSTITQDHDHTIYGLHNISKLICPHLGGYCPRHFSYSPLLHQSLRWFYRAIPIFLTWL